MLLYCCRNWKRTAVLLRFISYHAFLACIENGDLEHTQVKNSEILTRDQVKKYDYVTFTYTRYCTACLLHAYFLRYKHKQQLATCPHFYFSRWSVEMVSHCEVLCSEKLAWLIQM